MNGQTNSMKKLPGELGLWIFIFVDLALFTLFFSLAALDMGAEPDLFREGKAGLNQAIGMINTIILLTGSWAVAMGTRVVRDQQAASRYVRLAALSGIAFLLLKVLEYSHVLGEGHQLTDNAFYTWYFFLTGYHAMHVAFGVVLLWVVSNRFRSTLQPSEQLVEAGGCYWHLVDLLWIGIFLILYLL